MYYTRKIGIKGKIILLLTIGKIIENRRPAMENELAFHYCTIETFFNICKNNTLRLSDIEKSNDYSERVYMEELIKKELIEYAEGRNKNIGLRKLIEEWCYILNNLSNVYACCFSEAGDMLSQWRAYADNGYGVSIGFSKDILLQFNSEEYGLKFRKISYNIIEHQEFAKRQVKKIIDTLKEKNFYSSVAEVFENDVDINCFMKMPAFEEEREWRLLIALNPELRINQIGTFLDFQLSNTQLNTRNGKIVTYFDLNFSEVRHEFIKKIIIGPNCKMNAKDIYQSLRIMGFNTQNIDVLQSDATYIF